MVSDTAFFDHHPHQGCILSIDLYVPIGDSTMSEDIQSASMFRELTLTID